jgi:hypothetical protein
MKHDAYKCPDCDSYADVSDYSEGLVCPAHGKELEKVSGWSRAGSFSLVGDVWLAAGLPTGRIDHDNGDMTSMSMGCPNPGQQKDMMRAHAEAGIHGTRYDKKTGALKFSGGRATQKKLMKLHQMHDNN